MREFLVICLGFGLGSIVCAIQYFMIKAGRFRRNPYIGLPGYATRSDKAWNRAHDAAAPWIGRAAILAAVATAIALIGMLLGADSDAATVLFFVSIAFGVVAAGIYLLGASGAAHEATKRLR